MIKKIVLVFLCLCLSFSMICYGENAENNRPDKMPPMSQRYMTPPENGKMPPLGEMPEGAAPPTQGEQVPQNAPTEDVNENPMQSGNVQEANGAQSRPQGGNWREQGGMPSFGQGQGMPNMAEEKSFFETYFDAVMSVVLLILAYIFVIFYKRRQY